MTEAALKEKIWLAVAMIPCGCVATYGQIAQLAGYPNHARYVGSTLRNLPSDSRLPWHRVINAQGKISFPAGSDRYHGQQQKLEAENIEFNNERVSLNRYQWRC